ncbi:MAG: hypothetical protein SchgKO_13230 [Schleiferiaceae bacterium]
MSCSKEPENTYPRTYGGTLDVFSLKWEPSPSGNLYHFDTIFDKEYVEITVHESDGTISTYMKGRLYVNLDPGKWSSNRAPFSRNKSLYVKKTFQHAHTGWGKKTLNIENYTDYLDYKLVNEYCGADNCDSLHISGVLYPL